MISVTQGENDGLEKVKRLVERKIKAKSGLAAKDERLLAVVRKGKGS